MEHELLAALKVAENMFNQLLNAAEKGIVPDISVGFFKNRTEIIEPAIAAAEAEIKGTHYVRSAALFFPDDCTSALLRDIQGYAELLERDAKSRGNKIGFYNVKLIGHERSA